MSETTPTSDSATLAETIRPGYVFEGPALELGALMADATTQTDVAVRIPLAMLNRHGLVAGATGTGKTKTLQLMAEQLSAHGVPVFAADIKGDLSGLSTPGETSERVSERAAAVGVLLAKPAFMLAGLSLTPAWIVFAGVAIWYLTRGNLQLGLAVSAAVGVLIVVFWREDFDLAFGVVTLSFSAHLWTA